MWYALSVRHDSSFLRVTEKPMMEHIADKLNEIEKEHGIITMVNVIEMQEDKYAEMIVQVKDND
jgi:hypothetical protein